MACGCGQKNNKNSASQGGQSSEPDWFLDEFNEAFPGEKVSLIDAVQFLSGVATIILLAITIKKL